MNDEVGHQDVQMADFEPAGKGNDVVSDNVKHRRETPENIASRETVHSADLKSRPSSREVSPINGCPSASVSSGASRRSSAERRSTGRRSIESAEPPFDSAPASSQNSTTSGDDRNTSQDSEADQAATAVTDGKFPVSHLSSNTRKRKRSRNVIDSSMISRGGSEDAASLDEGTTVPPVTVASADSKLPSIAENETSAPNLTHNTTESFGGTPAVATPCTEVENAFDENATVSSSQHAKKATRTEKRLPGRKRQPNPDVNIEADLRRQLQLKTAYRAVAKALKPILAELARRSIDEIKADAEAHKRHEQYEIVLQQLDDRLLDRIAFLNKSYMMKKTYADRSLQANCTSRREEFAHVVHSLQDDYLTRCQCHLLSVERDAANDSELTDEEDGPVAPLEGVSYPCRFTGPLHKKYDSRSRYFEEVDRLYQDKKRRDRFNIYRRQLLATTGEQGNPTESNPPKLHFEDFATYNSANREQGMANFNVSILAEAAKEYEEHGILTHMDSNKASSMDATINALDVLASASEIATPATTVDDDKAKKRKPLSRSVEPVKQLPKKHQKKSETKTAMIDLKSGTKSKAKIDEEPRSRRALKHGQEPEPFKKLESDPGQVLLKPVKEEDIRSKSGVNPKIVLGQPDSIIAEEKVPATDATLEENTARPLTAADHGSKKIEERAEHLKRPKSPTDAMLAHKPHSDKIKKVETRKPQLSTINQLLNNDPPKIGSGKGDKSLPDIPGVSQGVLAAQNQSFEFVRGPTDTSHEPNKSRKRSFWTTVRRSSHAESSSAAVRSQENQGYTTFVASNYNRDFQRYDSRKTSRDLSLDTSLHAPAPLQQHYIPFGRSRHERIPSGEVAYHYSEVGPRATTSISTPKYDIHEKSLRDSWEEGRKRSRELLGAEQTYQTSGNASHRPSVPSYTTEESHRYEKPRKNSYRYDPRLEQHDFRTAQQQPGSEFSQQIPYEHDSRRPSYHASHYRSSSFSQDVNSGFGSGHSQGSHYDNNGYRPQSVMPYYNSAASSPSYSSYSGYGQPYPNPPSDYQQPYHNYPYPPSGAAEPGPAHILPPPQPQNQDKLYRGSQYGGQMIMPANADARQPYYSSAPTYANQQLSPAFSQLRSLNTGTGPSQGLEQAHSFNSGMIPSPHTAPTHSLAPAPSSTTAPAPLSGTKRRSRGRSGISNQEFRRYYGPKQR